MPDPVAPGTYWDDGNTAWDVGIAPGTYWDGGYTVWDGDNTLWDVATREGATRDAATLWDATSFNAAGGIRYDIVRTRDRALELRKLQGPVPWPVTI